MEKKPNPCVFCYYARMRTDICEIYCTGGFQKEDGRCEHFEDYDERKRRMRRERALQKQGLHGQASVR